MHFYFTIPNHSLLGWNHTFKFALTPSLPLLFVFCTYSSFCQLYPYIYVVLALFALTVSPPFHFLSFPSVLYDSFSHTLYIHPLSSSVLHSEKKAKEGGVCWGVYRLERFVCMCVCALLCSAQRWVCLPACLPPLLQLLVWSPSKLYDLFSQRQRSKTPSDHRESSARGFNDFTTKMSAMAGAALSGTRRKREG